MPNLVVDIGNSAAKLAVFKGQNILYSSAQPDLDTENLLQLIKKHEVKNLILSSVRGLPGINEEILATNVNYVRFNAKSPVPVQNLYETPHTLGQDRLAAVVGAKALFPQEACFVIDAGTCITYDAIDEKGIYRGGSISPGIRMRFEAMNQFTAKLPLVDFDPNFSASFGANSEDAMRSGVNNGAYYEAEGFARRFLNTHPEGKIILCGGDAAFFDTKFKNSIFAHLILHEPNLVLIGLNSVVNYQNDHI
ncbi:type III pantothenate kinase [Pelobium manganitolerans]|uniref:type III pantothenate kinase n=1 Tax=Pelobium manganitolerans TaxID=1842495 RepID=UPI003FA36AC0